MNTPHPTDRPSTDERFAKRVVLRLTLAEQHLPHEVTERLRAARVRAVEKRKSILMQGATPVYVQHGTLIVGQGNAHPWWNRLGALGLLLTLLLGLFIIAEIQDDLGARELAEIDAALLTDDLPPAAYLDSGFVQYLKVSNRQDH